jgi:SAM-dependent methyltransferase
MFRFTPSLDPPTVRNHLQLLIKPEIDASLFKNDIRRMARMFTVFVASCPPPWPAPGLALTPEDHYQSELWLPLAHIRPAFQRLYRTALGYPPILSSTPFAVAASWAAIASSYLAVYNVSVNPALLLERVVTDASLRAKFLLWSFLPARFYGNSRERYPAQTAFVGAWLAERKKTYEPLRVLDAACGDGAGTYGLARLLLDQGWPPDAFGIEGWTIEPLEVWAAAHACFPHDPRREELFRSWAAPVFQRGAERALLFRRMDLQKSSENTSCFDLILCNGLLGGPIIHQEANLRRVAENLAALLRPGGILLAADHFHGGWKKNIPKETLGDAFKRCGLIVGEAGEGIGGLKPDQHPSPCQAAAECHGQDEVTGLDGAVAQVFVHHQGH